MIDLLGLIGNASFSLASLVVGTRLLLQARKTRQRPELWIGASFISGGVIGHTLWWTLAWWQNATQAQAPVVLWVTARMFVAVSMVLILWMAWKVFRPDWPAARVLVALGFTCLLGYVFLDVFTIGLSGREMIRHPAYSLSIIGRTFPYVWITWESLLYRAALLRRGRIGLPVDHQLVARMMLWAIGLGSIAALHFTLNAIHILYVLAGTPKYYGIAAFIFGGTCTVSLGWAFLPPKAVLRRLAGRGSAGGTE